MMVTQEEQSTQQFHEGDQPPAPPRRRARRQDQQPDGQQQEQPTAVPQDLSQSFQQQISQAVQPVLGNLQQQIAQALRQQMDQGFQLQGERPGQAGSQAVTPQPAAGHPQSQADQQQQPSGLEGALRQTATAVQQAIEWLTRMARSLFETLRTWVDRAVAAVRTMAISAVVEAVRAALRPLLRTALDKGANALQQQGRRSLDSVRRELAAPRQGGDQRQEAPAAASS